jgi:hypothetical protein
MKAAKILASVVVAYVGIIVVFESLIGYFQPADASTLVLTTFDGGEAPHDRVLSRIESNDQLYVAANHWTRAWYNRALEKPEVYATLDGERGNYLAAPVMGEEHDRLAGENSLGVALRVLTGFPPRKFVRLDPR